LLPHRTDHRGYVLLGWRVTLTGTALDASGAKIVIISLSTNLLGHIFMFFANIGVQFRFFFVFLQAV
jgi:hypothetical protein